jgi:hypothetical protein
MPAYIQLDHVYGLVGFDLNMSSAPPAVAPYVPIESTCVTNEEEIAMGGFELDEAAPIQLPSVAVKAPAAFRFHHMFPTKRPRFIVQR